MLSVWIYDAHGLRSWVRLFCVEPPVYWSLYGLTVSGSVLTALRLQVKANTT